jgi:hypothetical protein
MKIIGYLVIEKAEEYEQPLGLQKGKHLPAGGLLVWTDGARAVFPNRKNARNAITRTDQYRRAFESASFPEAKYCKIVPLHSA